MSAAAIHTPPAEAADVRWDAGGLVITRVFAAPRALVFRAWTQADHFARWFGPRGSTLPFCVIDARPGGTLHFCHRFHDHADVWVRGTYDAVAAPERLAFTCFFSDPAGARVPRPGFPDEMRIDVAFAEHPEGTEVTLRQTGLVRDQGEVQGWREALDRLHELLAGG